jgi:multidrug resistance efflux pump
MARASDEAARTAADDADLWRDPGAAGLTRPRFLRWLILAALAVTAVSGSLVYVSRRAPSVDAPREPKSAGGGSAAGPAGLVVCFGHVDLERGVTGIAPTQSGRIRDIPVGEGQHVHTGDLLVQVDDEPARLRLAEAEAALRSAKAQQTLAKRLPEQNKAKVDEEEGAVEAVQKRLSAARHQLAAKRKLLPARQVGEEEVAALADQVGELEALERIEQRKLAELRKATAGAEIEHADAEVAVLQARRDQAEYAVKECAVRAPRDGEVLRVLANVGDMLTVPSARPVIQFCPEGARLIRCEVDQEFADRVKVEQPVRIEDDVRSGPGWRGKVLRVSDWYSQRRSVSDDPTQAKDVRTVECLVSLEEPIPLRLGQRVRVFIGAPEH